MRATPTTLTSPTYTLTQPSFAGNHELWTQKGKLYSLEKFFAILELCDAMGVLTRPVIIKHSSGSGGDGNSDSGGSGDLAIVPLFSW
jgi:hypothetical protein